MSFISYAQNFEDVMLWRALKHVAPGFYIDVGANDPEVDSVTKAFYDRGWRGINIEPVAQWFHRLEEMRPHDINLQLAAGAEQGELLLYELPGTGLSTTDKTTADRHEIERGLSRLEQVVPVETLTAIYHRYSLVPIHFLKIDVEGAEKDVILGTDFSVIRPWIIVVESTFPMTQIEGHMSWDGVLRAANYDYVYFDGLNRFYVSDEQKELKVHFHSPPNIFDDFLLSGSASHPFCRLVESGVQGDDKHAQDMEVKVQSIEQKNKELTDNCHYWYKQAKGLESEINILCESWSWRITAPLRWAGGLTISNDSLIRTARHLRRMSRTALHRLAALLMRPILRRPGLSDRINQHLMRYPWLHQHLRSIARHNGMTPGLSKNPLGGAQDLPMALSSDLLHLTPRAREIYSDLKVAIEKMGGHR